jgi:acetyltransferase-like isoleucine patch superfamily enzyme
MVFKLINPIGLVVGYIKFKLDRLRLNRLVSRGLKIGKNVYIFQDVEIDSGYPFLIEIGDNCRISKGVIILAHDATTFKDIGITRVAPVKILEGSFIGTRAIILPGVTIGPKALVAAGSVVNRDIPEGKAAAGNPARLYSSYSEIIEKYKKIAPTQSVFDFIDIEQGIIKPQDIINSLRNNRLIFVRSVPTKDRYYVNADMKEIRENARQLYEKLASEKEP